MNPSDIIQKLDEKITERSILNHPFYKAWKEGNLTKTQLESYAKIYYPHVEKFTDYLKAIIDNTDDRIIKYEAEKNYSDELTHPYPHYELWLRFAEGLGLKRDEVLNSPLHPAAENIINTFQSLADKSPASGLAALYAYESQQPEVSQEKIDGLINKYGISDQGTLEYFDVHSTADIEHRQGERNALMRCLKTGTSAEEVNEAVDKALDAYWELLNGIELNGNG